jgi:hypothetical protein
MGYTINLIDQKDPYYSVFVCLLVHGIVEVPQLDS